jgi:hypothetical protein
VTMVVSEEERAHAIASMSQAVLASLGGIEEAGGVELAAGAAELLARLSIIFLLQRAGPKAASAVMVRIYHDLLQDIAASNAGSSALS